MVEKKQFSGIHLAVIAGVSLLLGFLVQRLLPVGNFWLGFLGTTLVIFISGAALFLAWRAAGAGKALAAMMLAAFVVRLVLGVFLAWGLPRFGYAEREQQAGFVFADAFRRENEAWALVGEETSLLKAFSDDFGTDQYGGMLIFSALVYRIFSPDAHRPVLVSILAAAVFALSIPFIVAALKRWIGPRVAALAGWILALYPEGVLLGAAQMREPFLILFFAMAFWAVSCWLERTRVKRALAVFALAAAGMLVFSFRVALPLLGVLLVWVWLEESTRMEKPWLRIAGWAAVAVGLVALFFAFQYWIDAVLHWDTLQTILQSGRVQFELESVPAWLHFPFIAVYGLFQPVLPAAIVDPAPWIWRGLGIFRALGWYALLPFLLVTIFTVWRAKKASERRLLILMMLFVWLWVGIASARGGGDQWDNPRYRTILLPWMAGLAAWAIQFARAHRNRWLPRWLAVEGVFLLFFTEWYISRYYPVIPRLDFWVMIALILGISGAILLGGWLWDRKHPPKGLTGEGDSL